MSYSKSIFRWLFHCATAQTQPRRGSSQPDEDSLGYEVGDVVELRGRTGCGKTLALRCILRGLSTAPRDEVSTIVDRKSTRLNSSHII